MTNQLRKLLIDELILQNNDDPFFDAMHVLLHGGTTWKGLTNMSDHELLVYFAKVNSYDSPWATDMTEFGDTHVRDIELKELYSLILAEYPTDPR